MDASVSSFIRKIFIPLIIARKKPMTLFAVDSLNPISRIPSTINRLIKIPTIAAFLETVSKLLKMLIKAIKPERDKKSWYIMDFINMAEKEDARSNPYLLKINNVAG
jgi:hypothetical protein